MKLYVLITSYNWAGEWGLEQTSVFALKQDALLAKQNAVDMEVVNMENNCKMVVNGTNESNIFFEKWLEKICSDPHYSGYDQDLYYTEEFEDSTILVKYGDSSSYHIEWTIQEIEI